jgi:secretion/DNA translocation related TadE-like protein
MDARFEEGSGTMAGAMLVMAIGVALAVTACVGNLMICQNRARSLADLIAFDAAFALWQANDVDPCVLAREMASSNDANLTSCVVEQEDVWVTVAVSTMVPVAPHVERTARAGPVECPKGDTRGD